MSSRHIDYLQDVLITVHMNIRDLQERKAFADPQELTYIDAKLQAYTEVLAIFRMSADEFGIDRKEIGI